VLLNFVLEEMAQKKLGELRDRTGAYTYAYAKPPSSEGACLVVL